MIDIFINRDCKYYDWGDTAPREYGAFCSKKKCTIEKANCKGCNEAIEKIKITKAMINKSGNGYTNVKVLLPTEWAVRLGIINENRDLILELSKDENEIIIKKK